MENAGAILVNELNEIGGLLLRVNVVVGLFGLFVSEKANTLAIVILFTLLGHVKVLMRDGYFEKPYIEKIVKTFANVLAGLVIVLIAFLSQEIDVMSTTLADQPALDDANIVYKILVYVLWHSTISINTSILMKVMMLFIDII